DGSGDVAWYRLPEPVRQYAAQQLAACGEAGDVRARHAAWYLSIGEQSAPALRGPEQGAWLSRLDWELGNLRAALGWAEESGELATQLRLASSLVAFWEMHGHMIEGRRWLRPVLAAPPGALSPAVRTAGMFAIGRIAQLESDLDAATSYLRQSLALAREEGPRSPRRSPFSRWWLDIAARLRRWRSSARRA